MSGSFSLLDPRCARARAAARVPGAHVTFVETDGAQYSAPTESFDLAMCIGASWIFHGHRGTLRALAHFVRPGRQVLVGEPFWRQEPPAEYLAAEKMTVEAFATHAGNVAAGIAERLTPLYTLASGEDDWDRYEGL